MLLAQVEGFLEVARRGNVSRAAEAMFVTQPTLTARLHALERELGEPLFARTRRGMRLTDAGRAFLPYAERAMRAVRDGRQALTDARSASAGRLVLGAAPAVSTYVLPALLQRFAAAYPRIEVVVPPGHPFAKRSTVGIADVASERLIFFDRTSSYYELTQSFFLSLGVTPREVMELDNIESAKKMVERRLGIALLPRTAVSGELAAKTLTQVAVTDAPAMSQKIVVIRRRDQGRPSGTVAAFLNLVRESDPAAV